MAASTSGWVCPGLCALHHSMGLYLTPKLKLRRKSLSTTNACRTSLLGRDLQISIAGLKECGVRR